MIVPNPAVLQQAVDRYRALAADGNIAVAVSLQNAAYTLCVLTGTRTVEEALTAADRLCSRATASGSPHRRTLTLTSTSAGPLGSSGETASGERELVA
ncbi:DUF5133 domain-containing protein [Streptomyces sp. NPDC088847]|uniref:DUF5133 domain-containing protein n=1 Tax=Streptomyces sp. NPDC088847 TaxID=3365909 RepID=UPI0037FC9333